MKLLLLSLFLIYASSHVLDYKYDKNVLVLTEANFVRALNMFPYVLIQFQDDSFPNAKKDATEFAKAAKELAKSYTGLKLAKIDAPTNKTRATQYGATAESNMRLFVRNGYEPVKYEGGSKSQDVISWILGQIDSSIPVVETYEQVQEMVKKNENVVLFVGSYKSEDYTVFSSNVVNTNDADLVFIRSESAELKKHLQVKEDANKVVIFRNFDQERSAVAGPLVLEELANFVNARKYPVVSSYDRRARHRINIELRDAILLFKGPDAKSQKVEEEFRKISGEYRDRIGFVVIEAGETFGRNAAKGFQIEEASYPRVGIIQASNKFKKYLLDKEINEKSLRVFLENFFAENLRVFCKSEPLPEEEFDGDIKVVVGRTYNRVVLDDSRDVLIELYSPSCPFCKMFAPTYKALAEKLKGEEGILVAKVDAIANEFEDLDITGIPVVKFYPRGNKTKPITISDRNLDGLYEAVKKHGTWQKVVDL